jgi:hypothetical protein
MAKRTAKGRQSLPTPIFGKSGRAEHYASGTPDVKQNNAMQGKMRRALGLNPQRSPSPETPTQARNIDANHAAMRQAFNFDSRAPSLPETPEQIANINATEGAMRKALGFNRGTADVPRSVFGKRKSIPAGRPYDGGITLATPSAPNTAPSTGQNANLRAKLGLGSPQSVQSAPQASAPPVPGVSANLRAKMGYGQPQQFESKPRVTVQMPAFGQNQNLRAKLGLGQPRGYASGTDNVNTNGQGMQTMPGNGGSWNPNDMPAPPPAPAPTQNQSLRAKLGYGAQKPPSSFKNGAMRVPGRPTRNGADTVPAMLRPREAVLTPGAANKVGRKKIARMNKDNPPPMGSTTREAQQRTPRIVNERGEQNFRGDKPTKGLYRGGVRVG